MIIMKLKNLFVYDYRLMWPIKSHHFSPISFYQIFPTGLTAQTPILKSFGTSGAHYKTGCLQPHMIWNLSLRLGLLSVWQIERTKIFQELYSLLLARELTPISYAWRFKVTFLSKMYMHGPWIHRIYTCNLWFGYEDLPWVEYIDLIEHQTYKQAAS